MSTAESLSAPRAAGVRVPDFFIVGHHKSGTSALYEMLGAHPQIFLSPLKEPRFMASDMRERFRQPRERPHPQTLDEYLALFAAARPDQRAGEASATYLWSRTAAERIAQLQPAARIIAILREPASFLSSLHITYLRAHVESEKDFGRALALEAARREGREIPRRSHLPQLLQYSDQVRYVEQLRRYHDRFPPEQVLVLIYDDFRADNEATVRTVLRFLDLDDSLAVEALERNVTTRTVRSHRADDIVYSVSLGRGGISGVTKAAIKAITTRRLRHSAVRAARRRFVMTAAPEADERLMLELRRRFKPEVAALSDYLGRDLVQLWGYDRLE
jgi:LmbE family N-acetylglucosaminyl deacetylase